MSSNFYVGNRLAVSTHAEEVHVRPDTCFKEGNYLEVIVINENKHDPYSGKAIRTAVLMNRSAIQRETASPKVSMGTILDEIQRSIDYTIKQEKENQMPHEEDQPATKQTWLEQLQNIRSMLSEGHNLMAQVIGPYLKDAQSMPDADSCSDRMSQELGQIARDVRNLVDAIANIHDKF